MIIRLNFLYRIREGSEVAVLDGPRADRRSER